MQRFTPERVSASRPRPHSWLEGVKLLCHLARPDQETVPWGHGAEFVTRKACMQGEALVAGWHSHSSQVGIKADLRTEGEERR